MKSWKQMHLGEEMIGGLSAGVIGTVIGFPLDLVKTRMQTSVTRKSKSILSIGTSIVRTEGIGSLYKGIAPPLISLSLLNTVTFAQYSFFREMYNANPGVDWRNFLSGASCAPVSGMVSTVENLVKTQMQLDNVTRKQFEGSWHCVKTLVGNHGLAILYTGHVINTIREAVFVSHYFFIYEMAREALTSQQVLSIQSAVPFAGGMAGASAWFISFPLDCVRAGVQGQSLPPSNGFFQVFRNLISERGVRGLYSGASASIARAFLVSGSRFSAYEGALWLIRGGRNYERHHD